MIAVTCKGPDKICPLRTAGLQDSRWVEAVKQRSLPVQAGAMLLGDTCR